MNVENIVSNRVNIIDTLKNILIDDLNLEIQAENIPDDAILFGGGIGLDSIDALQLIVGVEAKTGVMLPQDKPGVIRSINTITDYILQMRNQHSGECQLPRIAAEQYQSFNSGDYFAIRHAAGVIHNTDKFVLKFSGDDVIDVLDYLVTGKVSRLAENGILQTLILKDNGSVGAFVEIYNDFDLFYLVADLSHKDFILAQCDKFKNKEVNIKDSSESMSVITLTGPTATEIIDKALGNDVSSLRYLMFTHTQFANVDIIAARVSQTGEFSYVIIVPNNSANALITYLEKQSNTKIKVCDSQVTALLSLEACIYNEKNYHTTNPLALGLQWAIDFNKECFLGKDGLFDQKNASNHYIVIPFYSEIAGNTLEPLMPIKIAQQEVGKIEKVIFSPILGKYIGLAFLSSKFAFPGVTLECETNNDIVTLKVISAPFFATDSHLGVGV